MKRLRSLIRLVMPWPWHRYLSTALLLWLLSLAATQAPLFLAAPEPSDAAFRLAAQITTTVALATIVFGFAIGWTSRASSIVRCALSGALVLTTSQSLLTNWVPSGGEPVFPMPINFLIAVVSSGIFIAVLLGLGAIAASGTHRWMRPGSTHRVP